MKRLMIDSYINHLRKSNNYSNEKLEKIEYSLTGIYLTFSKIIIIFSIAIILGIFKEVLLFMIIFNIIRTTAFGLHASKSWICLLSSLIFFIGLPLISLNITINLYFKILLSILNISLIFKNAPADTKKRPIVNKKRRLKLKITSTIIATLFSIDCLLINSNFISNSLIMSLLLENILISPLTYKLFNLPYNNYIIFLEKHPDFIK